MNNKSTYRCMFFAVTTFITLAYLGVANAWTENTEMLGNINTLCMFEPEAQCSWAVRINAEMSGVDMNNASMASMRLDGANMQGGNFSHAIMQLASLKAANLTLANLEGAHMHGVNLQNANLMLANLSRVNLLDADLSGANLQGANLNGAILIKTKFDNATWTDGRTCAVGSIGDCR